MAPTHSSQDHEWVQMQIDRMMTGTEHEYTWSFQVKNNLARVDICK